MGEQEKPQFSKEEVGSAAQTIASIRMLLEIVPMELLELTLKDSQSGLVRYQTLGPMFDPTDFQRNGANKERDFRTQIESLRALIALKKAWRQDVPIDERIQEELDRGAPKKEDEDDE